jgi:azobenzene reductase
MKLLIVSGSQRRDSQSAKVAKYLCGAATGYRDVSHLELCRYDLPFWDGEPLSIEDQSSSWTMIKHKLRRADALVLITPEWGGMATPILKNFLLMCDAQETAHKPAMLVSVVSGISGAYPIAELRMSALKNNKLVAVPDHLIIRNVNEVLNDESESTQRDISLRNRIEYSLQMLHQYSEALGVIRRQHQSQPFPKQQEYAYGM